VEEAGQGPGDYQLPHVTSEFVTAAIPRGNATRFYLNADGLGDDAVLKIALLDEHEKPIPGCSGKDAAVMRVSGFQTSIAWGGTSDIKNLPERIRLHVAFEGAKRSQIRFSAIYLK
jgi:hypothetical protein